MFNGHAHTIRMVAAEYSTANTPLIALPSNAADAQKWCFDPNFVPSPSYATFGVFPGDYPLQSPTETCAQAVADLYGHATVNP